MPKTIAVQNTVPHLIEALWNHKDCPAWLRDVVWEGINGQIGTYTKFTAVYWASCLESYPLASGEMDGMNLLQFPAAKARRK